MNEYRVRAYFNVMSDESPISLECALGEYIERLNDAMKTNNIEVFVNEKKI